MTAYGAGAMKHLIAALAAASVRVLVRHGTTPGWLAMTAYGCRRDEARDRWVSRSVRFGFACAARHGRLARDDGLGRSDATPSGARPISTHVSPACLRRVFRCTPC